MTEIVLAMINEVSDLSMFKNVYMNGEIKLNISKISRELGKDRKTIKKYLKGEVSNKTRNRKKYLDDYKDIITNLLKDTLRSFDYIDHLYFYLKREHNITCSRSTLNRYIRNDEYLNKLFSKKKEQIFY